MIRISVFGKENDLNRELSKRGLMRVAGKGFAYRHPEEEDADPGLIFCFVIGSYQTPAYKKLQRWFMQGNKAFDPAFPKRKMYSSKPGNLESYVVWS